VDTLVVALIVILAVGYLGRRLWRSFHGRPPACGGGCSACPIADCSLKQEEPAPGNAAPDGESPLRLFPENRADQDEQDE